MPTKIEWQGLAERAVRIPTEADNLRGLSANADFLFYVKSPAGFYGRGSNGSPVLFAFDIKARRESVLLAGVGGYTLAPDGGTILTNSGGFKLLDARPGAAPRAVRTDGLRADRIPALEWAEIYSEVWRKYRDFFYVRNMHGYNWDALGAQYRALLPHVAHRFDLSYVLTELISELNIGHAYITGGDYHRPHRARAGLPGAVFTIDTRANLYRIAKIHRGQNEEPRYRSPLTEPGVDARVGDYVLEVDGVPLTATENIYSRLRNRSEPVTLTLNAKPTAQGARKTTYVPLDSEASLRYLGVVLANYDYVKRKTGGRVGYLHIPDMGGPGAYEFIKWYYPQIRKEGLVIDARGNRGGNISQWLIMRLNQKLLGTRFGGPARSADAYPALARHGSQVCLINENAGSDGDIFPWNFRLAGLGPLIGKRTWGGVVGISGVGPLLDGGSVTVPLRGTNAADGSWVIEGHGVDPDIEVEYGPQSGAAAKDPQLERGITEVLKRIKSSPKVWPKRPADPVKTKAIYAKPATVSGKQPAKQPATQPAKQPAKK
ncbi:MAG: PDZ domain-containing protein [Puniceicoccales bacterium]|nr:PDZ domain-containing protein [Puniceicoccales bacterium]